MGYVKLLENNTSVRKTSNILNSIIFITDALYFNFDRTNFDIASSVTIYYDDNCNTKWPSFIGTGVPNAHEGIVPADDRQFDGDCLKLQFGYFSHSPKIADEDMMITEIGLLNGCEYDNPWI